MAQICQVCNHPKRLEIDRLLVQGISFQKIANQFAVDAQSIRRHKENHLSRQLIKSHELKEAMQSGNLLTEIEDLLSRSKVILIRAEKEGKLGLALGAIRETRGTLELMSKIAITLHQMRAQELQAQQGVDDEASVCREGLEKLSDTELSMLLALTEKMAGHRRDDVIKVVMQEASFSYHPSLKSAPRRSGRRLPACYDDEWTEDKEQQALEEEKALAEIEPDELEPLGHTPLDLDELSLTEHAHAGTWGARDDTFKRAVEPGSIRTTDPQLRRLFDLD